MPARTTKAPPRRARVSPPVEQPTANAARGEHELVLQDVTYRLRPSREALKTIESKTGVSVLILARRGDIGDLTLMQLGVIAAALIRAGADDEATRHVNAERLEELIVEESMVRVAARLTFCLADACTGGRDASGNARAATA